MSLAKKSFFFLFLLSIFGSQTTLGFQISADTSSVVEVRIPDEDSIEAYQNDEDFNYEVDPEESQSWMLLFLAWILDLFGKVFGNTYGVISLKFILILFFVIALALLINALFKGNMGSAFTGQSASKKLKVDLNNEHIDSVDLDALMKEAIRNKDFRLAARYLYLKALQNLNEANLIVWAVDKTNSEYLNEIQNHPGREAFSKLTLIHDYTEYGDFEIDGSGFSNMKRHYENLLAKLGSRS